MVRETIWDRVFSDAEWGKYPSESLIQFVARNFYKQERNKVNLLEIGCGPGANLWYLSREGFSTYGIDGSGVAIEKARRRLSSDSLHAELAVGDILEMGYPSSFFDGVIDVECLYCNSIADSDKILRNIHRVLKPDGLFYSRTFSEKMFIGEQHLQLNDFEYEDVKQGPFEGKGFVRLIDRKGISELYGKCFRVLSVDELSSTRDNGNLRIDEWVIISQKKRT